LYVELCVEGCGTPDKKCGTLQSPYSWIIPKTQQGEKSQRRRESHLLACHDELSYHLRVVVGTAWN
jgi:hypothetical protein